MAYWLIKSEPDCYSIDDLKRDKKTQWDGVRNYQARNIMRDKMKKGDEVLFYHSSTEPMGVVGLCKVVSTQAYPDPTQFDSNADHFDPKATKNNPPWVVVDVGYVKKLKRAVTLAELKNDPFFNDMPVTKRGMRLSVQPVAAKHFKKIVTLGT